MIYVVDDFFEFFDYVVDDVGNGMYGFDVFGNLIGEWYVVVDVVFEVDVVYVLVECGYWIVVFGFELVCCFGV